MFEIELKYRVEDKDLLHSLLVKQHVAEGPLEKHEDTYYQHPCRDFSVSREALRIRRVDGIAYVTYKGPKETVSSGNVGEMKWRRELEWSLAPGDSSGQQMHEMLLALGFRLVATVVKSRRGFTIDVDGIPLNVAFDSVEGLGDFLEIEAICANEDQQQVAARAIAELAGRLNVSDCESKSYLQMHLERR